LTAVEIAWPNKRGRRSLLYRCGSGIWGHSEESPKLHVKWYDGGFDSTRRCYPMEMSGNLRIEILEAYHMVQLGKRGRKKSNFFFYERKY
jgi:hypothetical protein